MTRELRRLSLIMLAMFVALFGATSWIQVVQAGDLSEPVLHLMEDIVLKPFALELIPCEDDDQCHHYPGLDLHLAYA